MNPDRSKIAGPHKKVCQFPEDKPTPQVHGLQPERGCCAKAPSMYGIRGPRRVRRAATHPTTSDPVRTLDDMQRKAS